MSDCEGARRMTEGITQIPSGALASDPPDLPARLGEWHASSSLDAIAAEFAASGPVPHVVIDHFFDAEFAKHLRDAFPPAASELWHVYDNPLEMKRACSDTSRMPANLREAIFALCGPSLVEAVRRITGVCDDEELQADPYCHGGGLHSHGRGGKLDLHLDYSIHPLSGLERRFNLIVYLTEEPWQPEYGGSLDLYAPLAEDASKPGARVASVLPCFNRALLFSTTAPSFHGFPSPITCPDDWRRNSLALYYLTPPRPEAPKRSKALYVAAPGQPHDPELERLRHIRATRRLEPADFESV